MKSRWIYAFLAILFPCLSFAQASTSYQCSFGNLQRRIEILSEPGVSVPCEVHYYKDSEMPGTRQVLWSAGSEAGYCEARTEEFVAKLREWGWECNAGMAAEPAMSADEPDAEEADAGMSAEEAPMSDDTETLTPAAD